VVEVLILSLSTIFGLYFGTVPPLWYALFSIIFVVMGVSYPRKHDISIDSFFCNHSPLKFPLCAGAGVLVSLVYFFLFVLHSISAIDDFNFPIVNFQFICTNIPTSPAYETIRACCSYHDFLDRGLLLIKKLFLNQWF
jgi:hypothetical protein